MSHTAARAGHRARYVVALLSAFALAVLGLWAGQAPAHADTPPGVTTSVLLNGSPIEEGAELHTGDALKLRVQYTSDAVGQELVITLGAGVSVSSTFPNNEAVESFTTTDTGVIVKFKDPWPDIAQGILDLDLIVDPVDTTTSGTLSWSDGTEHSVPVVFVKDGDSHEDVEDGVAKAVSPGNLDSYVLTDEDGNYLGIDSDILDQDLTYTLTISTPDGATRADGYAVSDLLPDGFAYVTPLTVTATETTWDENGYNAVEGSRSFVVDESTADSFEGHVVGDLVGPSVLTLTYTVRVDDIDALDAALQAAFEARNGAPGNYQITPTNTATFGDDDETATASVRLRGTVSGPCPSCNGDFAKSGDLTTVTSLTEDDGTLLEPVDIAYTLRANLAQWDGHSDNYTLNDNVVIQDDLIDQASWTTGTGFLTVTGSGPITSLTEAASCPDSAAEFADDEFVGQYCVNGQTLLINVGKDNTTDITIVAQAQLTTVDGLPTVDGVEDGTRYRVRNTATYTWGSSSHTTPNVDGFVVVPDASGEPVEDSSAFAKTAAESLSAVVNEPLEVPYVFRVDTKLTGVPAASTTIVDYVDVRYFDIDSDLGNVTVSGTYTGGVSLDADDFVLTFENEELTIVLSDTGKAKVTAANGVLTVNLTLTTFAFDGKETIDITNRAVLSGESGDPLFVSEVETQGSSYGAESETRKHVYDRVTNGGEWTQLLIDSGEEEDPIYVYRLQFIGHPGFGGVAIEPETDVLPAELEFVGFVSETAKATGDDPVAGPIETDEGNLVASFDATAGPSGTITLTQQSGTTFPDGATANVYFAARLIDDSELVINDFGISSTTIVPTAPSIDIEKWIDEGAAPEYDEDGALTNDGYDGDYDAASGKVLTAGQAETIRFTVSNDGPEALIDVAVSDALDSGTGEISGLVCTFPDGTTGTEWDGPFEPGTQFECVGTLPALEAGQSHSDTATVTGTGALSGIEVGDADEWHGSVAAESALATTGGQIAAGAILFGVLGVLGGGALLLLSRARRQRV
ncbi:MAG: hypothetical protein QM602_04350 [Microbacterium sp.]